MYAVVQQLRAVMDRRVVCCVDVCTCGGQGWLLSAAPVASMKQLVRDEEHAAEEWSRHDGGQLAERGDVRRRWIEQHSLDNRERCHVLQ